MFENFYYFHLTLFFLQYQRQQKIYLLNLGLIVFCADMQKLQPEKKSNV